MSARPLLLIDTDDDFRRRVHQIVSPFGFEIFPIPPSADALDHIASLTPEIIVIAVEEPDKIGYSLCRKAKKGLGKNIPIILTTRSIPPAGFTSHKKLRFHADEYIDKREVTDEDIRSKVDALTTLGTVIQNAPELSAIEEIDLDDLMELPGFADGDIDGAANNESERLASHTSEISFADISFDVEEPNIEVTQTSMEGANDDDMRMETLLEADVAATDHLHPSTASNNDNTDQSNNDFLPDSDEQKTVLAQNNDNIMALHQASVSSPVPTTANASASVNSEDDIGEAFDDIMSTRIAPSQLERDIQEMAQATDNSQPIANRLFADPSKAAAVDTQPSAEIENQQLRAEVDNLKRQINSLSAGGDRDESQQQPSREREFLNLREIINKKEKEILNFRDEVGSRDRQLVDANARIRQLERQRTDTEEKVLELESEMLRTSEHRARIEKELSISKSEAEVLQQQLLQTQTSFTTRMAEMEEQAKSTLDEAVQSLQEKMSQSIATLEQNKEAEIALLKKQHQESTTEKVIKLEQEKTHAIQTLESQHKDAIAAAVEQVQTTSQAEVARIESAHAEVIREMRQQYRETSTQLDALQREHAMQEQLLATKIQEVDARDSHLGKQSSRIVELEAQIATTKQHIAELNEQNTDYQEQITKAYQKIESDEATNARAKKAMATALSLLEEAATQDS